MSSNYNDTENYCKDCDRSIYGEYPSCDINIENDGRYVKAGSPCYCKVNSTVGGMVEKYPWKIGNLKSVRSVAEKPAFYGTQEKNMVRMSM